MSKAHVHEILEMIRTSGKNYSVVELQQAVIGQFGHHMRFNSCSIDGMNSIEAVDFLVQKGKFVPEQPQSTCCGACGG